MNYKVCGVPRVLGVLCLILMGTGCAAIEAGHEGVIVEQPIFFGHGGVDPVPTKTGRIWIAPTTHVVDVDVRPLFLVSRATSPLQTAAG